MSVTMVRGYLCGEIYFDCCCVNGYFYSDCPFAGENTQRARTAYCQFHQLQGVVSVQDCGRTISAGLFHLISAVGQTLIAHFSSVSLLVRLCA